MVNSPDSDSPPLRPRRRWRSPVFGLVALILILCAVLLVRSCVNSRRIKNPQPVPVVSATAQKTDVPVYLTALGSVTPTDTVSVKTQINGILLRVLYREGQMVKANDLLAEIDPRPYLAQLEAFEGQLARDVAQLNNARVDLARYQQLYPQGAVSQQLYATQDALVKQLEGTVKLDQGQIDQVKVNLIYTRIIAPFNGRVGLRFVDPGNFVQTTDTTPLVVVNEVQPITVIFALPEDNIPAVMNAMQAGKKLVALAYDRGQQVLLDTGQLLTIDNQINSTTGTVNLRAEFPNKNLRLFPNQFVNVNLLVNTLLKATLVPTAAIQHGPKGDFVYVLNANKTANIKSVQTSVVSGENTVITQGVSPGQAVVVEGADQLTDGATVTIAPKGS
jgi:membrane fusion protein, multidrug efflux system